MGHGSLNNLYQLRNAKSLFQTGLCLLLSIWVEIGNSRLDFFYLDVRI